MRSAQVQVQLARGLMLVKIVSVEAPCKHHKSTSEILTPRACMGQSCGRQWAHMLWEEHKRTFCHVEHPRYPLLHVQDVHSDPHGDNKCVIDLKTVAPPEPEPPRRQLIVQHPFDLDPTTRGASR